MPGGRPPGKSKKRKSIQINQDAKRKKISRQNETEET